MFRFVEAVEILSEIQQKVLVSKEYQSALQQYWTAKEIADDLLSNPDFLR